MRVGTNIFVSGFYHIHIGQQASPNLEGNDVTFTDAYLLLTSGGSMVVIDNDSSFSHLIDKMDHPSLVKVGILVKQANNVA
jgi:hypothetical protein